MGIEAVVVTAADIVEVEIAEAAEVDIAVEEEGIVVGTVVVVTGAVAEAAGRI